MATVQIPMRSPARRTRAGVAAQALEVEGGVDHPLEERAPAPELVALVQEVAPARLRKAEPVETVEYQDLQDLVAAGQPDRLRVPKTR